MNALTWLAAIWLLVLVAGMVSWEKSKKGRFRRTDLVVVTLSLLLGGAWFVLLMPKASAATAVAETPVARKLTATCAVVIPGDTADSVKTRLGPPDETRSEAETRGPGTEVWIYRDSRCAIHMLSNRVESLE